MFASREVEEIVRQAFKDIKSLLPKDAKASLRLELESDFSISVFGMTKEKGE